MEITLKKKYRVGKKYGTYKSPGGNTGKHTRNKLTAKLKIEAQQNQPRKIMLVRAGGGKTIMITEKE